MEVDEIVKATVERVERWGVYLNCDSTEIFVQIPELNWVQRIPDATEFTVVGEEFEVKILNIDKERGLCSGSFKQAHPELDPYKTDGSYEIGSFHEGAAVLNTDYGSFIEIAPGLEALIYSESAGNLIIGKTYKVIVSSYEADLRRMKVKLSK